MYLCVNFDLVGQSPESPTDADFLVNDGWLFFGIHPDDGEFYQLRENGAVPLHRTKGEGYLYVNQETGEAWQSASMPNDDEKEEIELDMLLVFKFENGRYYQLDEEGDWVKVGKAEMGNASCGDFHIFQ